MKVVVLKLVVLFFWSSVATAGEDHKLNHKLNKIYQRLNDAYHNVDLERASETYAKDGIFISTGELGDIVQGNPGDAYFKSWFVEMLKNNQHASIKFRVQKRNKLAENVVVDSGYYRINIYDDQDQSVMENYGKFLNIYRQLESGKWINWSDAFESNGENAAYWNAAEKVKGLKFDT